MKNKKLEKLFNDYDSYEDCEQLAGYLVDEIESLETQIECLYKAIELMQKKIDKEEGIN